MDGSDTIPLGVRLTIKNYRCFSDQYPLRIDLREGFTAFVGPNNVGKSAILRALYELRGIFFQIANDVGTFSNAIRQEASFSGPIRDWNEVFYDGNSRDLVCEIEIVEPKVIHEMENLKSLSKLTITMFRPRNVYRVDLTPYDARPFSQKPTVQNDYTLPIPSNSGMRLDLSQLRAIAKLLANTLYIGPFRNAINVGGNDSYFDIQTGQVLIQAWRGHKSGDSKPHRESIVRVADDIAGIFQFPSFEINDSVDASTFIIRVGAKSYRLADMGAGLAQFIIALANAAIKKPGIIMIDEPELGLHPSLQMKFLTALASYCTHGVLFATHNLGLARACAERVYVVRRDDRTGPQIADLAATPRLAEFLGEMNFAGYRELGYRRVLLVEGPSDVKTLMQMLRLYKKDRETVFLQLGGGTMIHQHSETELNEVMRLSGDVHALIDSERDRPNATLPADRAEFSRVCERVGIACHVLERRAIENYFSERGIQAIHGPKYRTLQPFEKLADCNPSWAKSDNWRIAREMSLSEFAGTDLGAWLESY